MAYVYRHIRLDKNEPFYIGIGSDKYYYRPRKIDGRNDIWKKIVAKTDYEIEILIDNISYDFSKVKEIEFIKLYGRIVDNTGTLSNLTLGGEGVKGHIQTNEHKRKATANRSKKHSEATKAKMRLAAKGRKVPIYVNKLSAKVNLGNNYNAKKVIDLNTGKIYESAKIAARELKLNYGTLANKMCNYYKNNTSLVYLKNISNELS